jgi:ChpA-C
MKVVYNLGALTAGALLATGAAGAAHAHPTMVSTDNVGVLNGTQALLPIQAPINVCGNAVAVAGVAGAACEGGAAASLDPEWTFDHFQMVSSDNVGIGNGTQVFAPIQAPVNVCGNAVAVAGVANAGCEGGADADADGRPGKDHHGHGYGHGKPGHGKPGGHGYYRPASHESEDAAGVPEDAAGAELRGIADRGPTMLSSGNIGVLNGTQVLAPVQVPINVCGNAISVLGVAGAGCEGGAEADL